MDCVVEGHKFALKTTGKQDHAMLGTQGTVTLVADDYLPKGHDWLAVEVDGRRRLLVRDAVAEVVLDEALDGLALLS